MQPSEDPTKALKWLPVGRRKVGRLRTTWRRMAQKEKDAESVWKIWEEAREVATNRTEWKRLVEVLCAI